MTENVDLDRLGELARAFDYSLCVLGTWPSTAETDAGLFAAGDDGGSRSFGKMTLGDVERYLTALSDMRLSPPRGPDVGGRPLFYWEVPASTRPEVLRQEEVYLAVDTNWGRRVVNALGWADMCIPDSLEPRPLELDEHPEDELLRYSDAVSSILQAATYVGIDAGEVCRHAQSTARGIYQQALDAAGDRDGGTRDGKL
jgi:hypothetical protein